MKSPQDLLRDPPGVKTKGKPDPPVTVVLGDLMTTGGERLELTARLNVTMARAVQIGYIFSTMLKCPVTGRVGSDFVKGQVEQIMRLSVSMDGKGRRDLIDALQAGGRTPDSFFATAQTNYQMRE